MRFRIRKKILFFALIIFSLLLILIVLLNWNRVILSLHSLYKNDQLVKWASIIVNLAVVIIALFLNITVEYIRRPRFRIDCGIEQPWQKQTRVKDVNDNIKQMHLRLRVWNVGRTCEYSTEVRVEKIYKITNQGRNKLIPLNDHDPRPLKWIGRDTEPIALNVGAFDFVDLGVRRSDILDRFHLEFGKRGHFDLIMENEVINVFRIDGTVYGNKAIPQPFTFDLRWDPILDLGPIEIRKVS
jgi:hypothetical protein